MWDNLLFLILGAGLVLAFQELYRQYTAFNQRRWLRQTDEIIALLDAPVETGYCRSWCHDSQAEHDADVSWSDERIQSATDDEILDRIGELSAQAERVWPGTPDTKW